MSTRTRVQPLIWLLLGAALLALLGVYQTSAAPTKPQRAPRCSTDGEFKHVPKQGRSCRMPDGTWKVKLRDGHVLHTHGPDALPESEAAAESGTGTVVAAASSHVCVPTSTNHGLIIYAYPSDQADRYATMVGTIRGYFQGAQDLLNTEAMVHGVTASYKMACDADGQVTVRREQLPTPLGSSDYGTIHSDLRAKGYTSSYAHYWIYFDGRIIACGQGEFHNDSSPSASNRNNTGPRYAISYGCNAMMHENGHNMGAVQNDSPNSSGAAHCNDDRDVMCYRDGGSKSGGYSSTVCTDREHYDCNQNDYFNVNPPSGSYLATHWNVAACYNRYIQRSGCGTTSTPIPATATRTRTPTTGGTLPTATRTRTPTSGGTVPTTTRTRTPTSGGTTGTCSPATAITAPFTFDGSGTRCWQIATIPSYINSWNLTSLTVNGVSFTNLYATPSQLPPKINGYWYISYNSSVSYGHFEVR